MLAIVIARPQIQIFNYSGSHLGAIQVASPPIRGVQTLPSPWQGADFSRYVEKPRKT